MLEQFLTGKIGGNGRVLRGFPGAVWEAIFRNKFPHSGGFLESRENNLCRVSGSEVVDLTSFSRSWRDSGGTTSK